MSDKKKKFPLGCGHQAADLFILIGQAVWSVQLLEDALSHSIIIKKPEIKQRDMADDVLASYRRLPLGRAVECAEKEKTYDKAFLKKLQDFVDERNWLIHRSMRESVDDIGAILDQDVLFQRIYAIGVSAIAIKEEIEVDMLKFCSANGRDDIRSSLGEIYAEWRRV